MIRAMYSASSGMRAHQTKMDIIGNNIANVNTTGFKATSVDFQDVYSQTSSPASPPAAGRGGQNPTQIGLGVQLGNANVNFSAVTGIYTTEDPLNVAIEGNGFFTVQVAGRELYTRNGNFYLDTEGRLVTGDGYFVLDSEQKQISVNGDIDKISKLSILKDGTIEAILADGTTKEYGKKIGITTFINPKGLQKEGNSCYSATPNSGDPVIDVPGGANGAGILNCGALEMSNVDLSKEFSDMILTQRGFQANARIITVADSMIEELVNLKR